MCSLSSLLTKKQDIDMSKSIDKQQDTEKHLQGKLPIGDVGQCFTYPKGCLTDSEWQELVALEYVLTWGYTDNEKEDSKRHRELSDKRWASLNVA
jgi:hypothetical protein